ncbi:aminopeptidase P family protein [Candidatus Aerophobetes bacterium]|uniref:Aminopeptidase P family protein n=1 Tax=Aerophobetes bacterium TaxID=2030807 RepID=A0A523S5I0_UNCAE|nr:MAG: aminopeptidase P family protein [Candidatus Aerophobetes bacterium]
MIAISNVSVPENEFKERVERYLDVAEEKNLDALVVYSNYSSNGEIRYLAGYTYQPVWMCASTLILSRGSEPSLLTDRPWNLDKVREETWIKDVRACGGWLDRPGPPGTVMSLSRSTGSVLREKKLEKVNIGIVGFDIMPAMFYEHLKEEVPQAKFVDVTESFEKLKMVRSETEIQLIRNVAKIASIGMETGLKSVKEGKTEADIASATMDAMMANGAEVIFAIWVVSGEATQVQYRTPTYSNRKLQKGDMLWIDFGIIRQGYFGDISRTTIVGPSTEQQRKLCEVVFKSHQDAVKMIKPGAKIADVVKAARRVPHESGYKEYVMGDYLGHGIGVTLDDYPVIVPDEPTEIKANMVLNIDPKLFVPGVGGARLEDTYLVTPEGVEKLITCKQRWW